MKEKGRKFPPLTGLSMMIQRGKKKRKQRKEEKGKQGKKERKEFVERKR